MTAIAQNPVDAQLVNEIKIAHFLARHYQMDVAGKTEGKDYQKDVVLVAHHIVRKELSLEIKCDYKARESGNIYLETENTRLNQLSGLRATRATWWVHGVPHQHILLIFPPERMLDYLHDSAGRAGHYEVRGGDNNSRGYAVRINIVRALPFVETRSFLFNRA